MNVKIAYCPRMHRAVGVMKNGDKWVKFFYPPIKVRVRSPYCPYCGCRVVSKPADLSRYCRVVG